MDKDAIRLSKLHNLGWHKLISLPLVIAVLSSCIALSVLYLTSSRTAGVAIFHGTDSIAFSSVPPFWQDQNLATRPISGADRPVYPYSVIPGGVTSSKELQARLHQDPVAAAHYRDFHAESARVIRLPNERQVYVSYRLGDRVYWSRHRITLHAGEAVLTDGVNLVRTRCGNRISETANEPTAPGEPPTEVMNHPVVPGLPFFSPESVPTLPFWPEDSTAFLLALGPTPQPASPGTGDIIPPLFPGIFCCSGSTGHSLSPGPLPQPYPPPGKPTVTPEPAALVLLIIGLAGSISLLKFRKS